MLLSVCFGLLANTCACAQNNWIVDVLVQRLPDGQAYLEAQTSWTSTSTHHLDSCSITVIATQSDNVVGFSKHRVCLRSNVGDSLEMRHVHVSRLESPNGRIQLEWIVDCDDGSKWQHNEELWIPLDGVPAIADPIVVEAFAPSHQASNPDFVHSGLELMPSVGKRIDLNVSSARLYFELHRISDVVPADSLFLLAFGWTNEQNGWDSKATKYVRLTSAPVVPVFDALPCTPSRPLPTNGKLRIEARTREGHVIVSRDIELSNRFDAAEHTLYTEDHVRILPSIAVLSEPLALIRHLEDHLPIATTNEQNTMNFSLMPRGNAAEIQSYLTGFWIRRCESFEQADLKHRQYLERIAFVDEHFGECKKGQGSLTEMGNIYLRFGPPKTVVQRHHETEYYPYEIWHYYKAGVFNNKRFLFYAPHVVAECFELLHSDMLGERQNDDWLAQLRSRENRLRVSESMENRLNPNDSFSREEPEDLFYNPR